MKRVIAVIPCLNEAKSISDIVSRAKNYVDEVIVADDSSTDDTKRVATEAGAIVIQNYYGKGFGGNVMSGILVALSEYYPDMIVTLDGDGQHNPDEIPKMVEAFNNNGADIIIGSRFLEEYKAPKYRKFGIDVITWVYNFGHKNKITDGQSCFRVYSRKLLEDIVIEDRGFGFSTEILIKARKKGYSIKEIPIACIYHKEFRMNSTMNPITQGLSVVLRTLKWRLKMKNGDGL